ncbi:MAG: hypothetical protein GY782_08590 [Gammaproteobacteria bacterium]|nr:hypothetical protein [Gammaproteobacteria bacterium]
MNNSKTAMQELKDNNKKKLEINGQILYYNQLTDNNEKMLGINGQILYHNYNLLQARKRYRFVVIALLIIILVLLIF